MPRIHGGSLEQHRLLVRDRIFATFSQLLYERGYDAITLADVASGAGMSRTAMYNHFRDKNELVIAFAEDETERYVADLEKALEKVDNPVDQLRVYVRNQFAYCATHHLPPGPALKALLAEPAYQRVLDHVGALERTLQRILEAAVAEGYVATDDLEATMSLVTACVNLPTTRRSGDDLQAMTAAAESFVLAGLGVRLDGAGRPRRQRRKP